MFKLVDMFLLSLSEFVNTNLMDTNFVGFIGLVCFNKLQCTDVMYINKQGKNHIKGFSIMVSLELSTGTGPSLDLLSNILSQGAKP